MSTEDRLARLEKMMRLWRYATIALLCLVVPTAGGFAFLLFGTMPSLRARRIEVRSDQGIAVVTLESVNSTGVIATRNIEGRRLFAVSSDEYGDGMIETFSAKGAPMVNICTTPTGGAIRVLNNLGREVVGLQSNKANCGLMMAKDVDGETREILSGSRYR